MEGGMRDVAMMIHKGEFDAVVTLLETREIHAEENREKNLKVWPYAAQMVAHMIQGDMAGARFVWLRRAASASSSSSSALPEEEAAFELLQRLWSNDFAGAHVAIHEFTTRLRAQGENEEHVTLLLLPLLEALQTKLRDRALALLRKSYSSVHIRDATAMLGLVQGGHEADGQLQAMMDVVQREGWKFDESTGYVSINFTATPAADELSLSDDHLQQLVDYAVHLSRA